MSRRTLTDRQWAIIEPLVPGKEGDRRRTGSDARLFVDAVLWLARTGSPWRDLPRGFGNWNTIYRRFRDWARAGVFGRMFNGLSDQPDMEMAMFPSRACREMDGTIVKVHRAGQGAKGGLKARP